MTIVSSENPLHTLVITDTSIKNNVATFIAHVYICNRPVTKTLYHIVNVNSMEAELFTIRCSINQAINSMGILKIIITTDSIYIAKKIFNLSSHLFQTHSVSILYKLWKFFALNQNNSIEFWEYSSQYNWSLHKVVDKEIKSFNLSSFFLYKLSWDYSQKKECNKLSNTWKITSQAPELKGWYFLDLYDNDNNLIKPSYIKDSFWLKYFGHSNSLYAKATRAITNYALKDKYRLRFLL